MTFPFLKETLTSTLIGALFFTGSSLIEPASSRANVRILAVPEKTRLIEDNLLSIKLYITNDAAPVISFSPLATIKATLKTLDSHETDVVRILLRLAYGDKQKQPFELAEGQFRILSYDFTLSEEMKGPLPQNLVLTLDLPGGVNYSVLVTIPSDQGDKNPSIITNENPTYPDTETAGDKSENTASFFSNFSGYEPIYFLYGAEPSNAKFQLSFKYRVINPQANLAQKWPWLSRLHLGYTQTAFWDLSSESRPFTDIIFQPALFYQYQLENPAFIPAASHFGILTGIQHQSNGKDGSESRSLNFAYIEPNATFSIGQNMELNLRARVWAYLGDLSDNPDIRDFRGNALISAGIGNLDGWMLMSELRGNPGTGKGSLQFDLSYPLNRILSRDIYFFGQLYSGYGESLIGYNRKDTSLRFGIALHR